jgi:branched-chain amino acid transport system substrate-binding protein
VKAKKPDLVYVGGFFQDLVTFFRQAKEMDLNAKAFIASAGPANANWMDVMKADGDYVFTNTFYNPALEFKGGPFPTTKAFNDFWKTKYGVDCDHYSSCGFIAGVLLQMATEKANSFEQAKIRDALASMDVETFFGRFKFDDKGQNIGGRENVMQIQSQKQILVWPEVSAGGQLIYPTPAWKDR